MRDKQNMALGWGDNDTEAFGFYNFIDVEGLISPPFVQERTRVRSSNRKSCLLDWFTER